MYEVLHHWVNLECDVTQKNMTHLNLVEPPGGGKAASILARVRVADHALLLPLYVRMVPAALILLACFHLGFLCWWVIASPYQHCPPVLFCACATFETFIFHLYLSYIGS